MNEYRIVTVRRDHLEAYMNEYHHCNSRDLCAACHCPWPCDIWLGLKLALGYRIEDIIGDQC